MDAPRQAAMIPHEEALRITKEVASLRRSPVQNMPLEDSLGMVLQSPVYAQEDHPPFNRAAMDGFALQAADSSSETPLTIVGESAAGKPFNGTVQPGEAIVISTGAVVPAGADAVLPVEVARSEGNQLWPLESTTAGRHVAPRGEDCPAGHVIARPGTVIDPMLLASLAAEGITTVALRRKPSIALLATGDEVVPYTDTPPPGCIRNHSTPALKALIAAAGLPLAFYRHVADTEDAVREALQQATETADIVLITGGVSMGGHDLMPGALRDMGMQSHFHHVKQKPGKPLLLGTLGSTTIFGLPGNPVSSLVMFSLFVVPAARIMQELSPHLPGGHGIARNSVTFKGDRHRLALATVRRSENGYDIYPLPGAGSADVFHRAGANAMLSLPGDVPSLAEGDRLAFSFLPGMEIHT